MPSSFTTRTQPIDIGGWYLSDAMNNLKKYRIPMGTQIVSMGFHVAYEHQFLVQNTLAPFALSSPLEIRVYLTQADANALVALRTPWNFPPRKMVEPWADTRMDPSGGPLLDHQWNHPSQHWYPQELISVFTNGKGAPVQLPMSDRSFSAVSCIRSDTRPRRIHEIRNRFSKSCHSMTHNQTTPGNWWEEWHSLFQIVLSCSIGSRSLKPIQRHSVPNMRFPRA